MAEKIKPTTLRKEIGSSGTVIIGGIITDQDYNQDLIGEEGRKNVDKMRKGDATVRAAILAVKLPILAANWFIEPASESPEDAKIADFVTQNLMEEMTITWQDFLRESLLYLDYGYYVWEAVYKDFIFEGQRYIGLHKLSPRLPGSIIAWQTKEKQDGITQWTLATGEVSIPIRKLLILTNEKEGDNWEGTTIFRSAYKHWYIKDNLYKIDAIAHERQGLGIPFVKKPETGATVKDQNKATELLKNLRANEKGYLEIPKGWDIGFMDMNARSTRDPNNSIKHHDRQIVKSVLAQFLELGGTGQGSFALSADQSDLFLLSLHAVASHVKDAVQKYVIERVVDLNFVVEKYPQLKYEKIGNVDLNQLSVALQRLTQTGLIIGDDELERHLRKVMSLPEMSEEDERRKLKLTQKKELDDDDDDDDDDDKKKDKKIDKNKKKKTDPKKASESFKLTQRVNQAIGDLRDSVRGIIENVTQKV